MQDRRHETERQTAIEWQKYGKSRLSICDFYSALDAFSNAESLGLRTSELYEDKASCLQIWGFPGEAIKEYKLALKLDPKRTSSLINLQDAYLRSRNAKATLAVLENAKRSGLEHPLLYLNAAFAYQMLGEKQESLKLANKVLKENRITEANDPQILEARMLKADLLEQTGDKKGSEIERSILRAASEKSSSDSESKTGDFSREFPYVYKNGKQIVVFSRSNSTNVERKTAELRAFLNYYRDHFDKSSEKLPIKIFVFPSYRDLFESLQKHSQIDDCGGNYLRSMDAIFVNDEDKNSFIHGAVHKILSGRTVCLDAWSYEGIAEYFACGGFQTIDGKLLYCPPKQLNAVNFDLEDCTLKRLVLCRLQPFNSGGADAGIALYLEHKKKLQSYLELASNGRRKSFLTLFEAAFNQPVEKIEADFALRKQSLYAYPARPENLVFLPSRKTGSYRYPVYVSIPPDGKGWLSMLPLCALAQKKKWIIVSLDYSYKRPPSPEELMKTIERKLNSIPATHQVNKEQIYCGGLSAGAGLAFQLLNLRPDVFSGLIANCTKSSLDLITNKKAKQKKIVLLASPNDFRYKNMVETRSKFQNAGWSTHWIEFPGGHTLAPGSSYEKAFSCLLGETETRSAGPLN